MTRAVGVATKMRVPSAPAQGGLEAGRERVGMTAKQGAVAAVPDAGGGNGERSKQPVADQLLVRVPAGPIQHEAEELVAEVGVEPPRAREHDSLPQTFLGALEAEADPGIGRLRRAQVEVRSQPRQAGCTWQAAAR
jgi:hypothetical protein